MVHVKTAPFVCLAGFSGAPQVLLPNLKSISVMGRVLVLWEILTSAGFSGFFVGSGNPKFTVCPCQSQNGPSSPCKDNALHGKQRSFLTRK